MQYCSLQHRTLFPSPVTSTSRCCFSFGSVSSFFLELFLHWSAVAYWAPTDLGSSSFSLLSFHTVHGVLKARILKWFAIPFSSGAHSVRPLQHDLSILGGPTLERMKSLDGITDSMDMSLSKLRSWWWTGRPGVLPSMGSQRVGHDWVTELNWLNGTEVLSWSRISGL